MDSEPDFGAVDPGHADGLNPPPAPGFLGRLQQAEAAAGAAAGLRLRHGGARARPLQRRAQGAQLDRPQPAHPAHARGPSTTA